MAIARNCATYYYGYNAASFVADGSRLVCSACGVCVVGRAKMVERGKFGGTWRIAGGARISVARRRFLPYVRVTSLLRMPAASVVRSSDSRRSRSDP